MARAIGLGGISETYVPAPAKLCVRYQFALILRPCGPLFALDAKGLWGKSCLNYIHIHKSIICPCTLSKAKWMICKKA